MNKPTLTTKKQNKMSKQEDLLDKASIVAAVLCAIIVIEVMGSFINYAFGSCEHSFFYNFVLGFGAITGIAFIFAAFQEIFEK